MSDEKKAKNAKNAAKSKDTVEPVPEKEYTEGAYVHQSLRRKPGGMAGKGR